MDGQVIEKLIEMLHLDESQNLMILFDAFGYENVDKIADELTNRNIPFCARFVPLITQIQYSNQKSMPKCLRQNIKYSDALIFFCTDHDGCTRFRSSVLNLAIENNCRILHLPGVDEKMFEKTLKSVEFGKLKDRATKIINVIQKAQKIEIFTSNKNNAEHCLEITLNGREIRRDIGIASPGEIAQLPPGEVYTAPKEFVASGSLVLNGSAPERVFHYDNELFPTLVFEKGTVLLEKSIFPNTVTIRGFYQDLVNASQSNPMNLVLAELGFGINEQIKVFTGKPIHDEKADGTLHIALGSNRVFGGEIDSDNHIDLIFIPDNVLIDGKKLNSNWGLLD